MSTRNSGSLTAGAVALIVLIAMAALMTLNPAGVTAALRGLQFAAFDRIALTERNQHLPMLELRPLVIEVDKRFVEAEQSFVEVPSPVEVSDEIPDASHVYNASAGSSTNCFSVRRKAAPSAPSTARWSTVSVIASIGRTTTAPSRATGVSRVAPTARIAA